MTTDSKRAKVNVKQVKEDLEYCIKSGEDHMLSCHNMLSRALVAISQVRAEEREACAKVAEKADWNTEDEDALVDAVAQAIRRRS